jgi:hypothetical protein
MKASNVQTYAGSALAAGKAFGRTQDQTVDALASSNGYRGQGKAKYSYVGNRNDKKRIKKDMQSGRPSDYLIRRAKELKEQNPKRKMLYVAQQLFEEQQQRKSKGGGGGGDGKDKKKRNGKKKKGGSKADGDESEKKKNKKNKKKEGRQNKLSMAVKAYLAIPEGANPKKMTAKGNIFAYLLDDPLSGGRKSDVFTLKDFDPHAFNLTQYRKNVTGIMEAMNHCYDIASSGIVGSKHHVLQSSLRSAMNKISSAESERDLFSRVRSEYYSLIDRHFDSKMFADYKDKQSFDSEVTDFPTGSMYPQVHILHAFEDGCLTALKKVVAELTHREVGRCLSERLKTADEYVEEIKRHVGGFMETDGDKEYPVDKDNEQLKLAIAVSFGQIAMEAMVKVYNTVYAVVQKFVYLTRVSKHSELLKELHESVVHAWHTGDATRANNVAKYLEKLKDAFLQNDQDVGRFETWLKSHSVSSQNDVTNMMLIQSRKAAKDHAVQKQLWNELHGALTNPAVTSMEAYEAPPSDKSKWTITKESKITDKYLYSKTLQAIRADFVDWFGEKVKISFKDLKLTKSLGHKMKQLNNILNYPVEFPGVSESLKSGGVLSIINAAVLVRYPVADTHQTELTYGSAIFNHLKGSLDYNDYGDGANAYSHQISIPTLKKLSGAFAAKRPEESDKQKTEAIIAQTLHKNVASGKKNGGKKSAGNPFKWGESFQNGHGSDGEENDMHQDT